MTPRRNPLIRPRDRWLAHDDRAVMSDLWRVGPTKPLGYLPLSTLKRHGFEAGALAAHFDRLGFGTRRFSPRETVIASGALYVFHRTLADLLYEYRALLASYGWPTEPQAFVQKVATVEVPEDGSAPLHHLIARAFGDPRVPLWSARA